uniref:Uncharacterized protein n=1 Tax=Candidatus Kentrum sp. FW TaxID=2126338 RepID=A0A450U400_9GAMM|nr:MAG: hypothetical protein BECKFW1821C_GA0114237_11541 [Candidatus Kentron sp. FW]
MAVTMKITASHIVEWANTHAKEAQNQLPRLIRRLCFEPDASRQLSFPAGDSTYRPGWDGVLFSEKGSVWVPAGASRWEIGCDKEPTSKANADYRKRTEETGEEDRSAYTFVFVTPRRWLKKFHWITEQRAKGDWKDVLAYDADDLEQWLEQSPAVALAFAEELGLAGPGVESLSRYWDTWSGQCDPAITPDAFFTDRTSVRDALGEKLQAAISQPASSHPLAIRADSVEEVAAFAVAVVMVSGNLQDQALVITEPEGWRYVEANPQMKIAIAARTETAERPVSRDGLLVIIPHATGDLAAESRDEELVLERPDIYQFQKALIAMGVEESDARRYAANTGRSWTVFRRQRATNPAIRHPAWLDGPQSASLTLVCLLGAWLNDNDADRQVVERLADRPYEDIEQELRDLAMRDDSPVLHIGTVWKAKSPLELLGLFGGRITRNQLDRFFSVARDLLSAPDPQLELPDEQRWAAQVYGKVHPYSGLLFDSICDSLIKLAVRGPEQARLDALHIEVRVANLVRELLDSADRECWLSLASYLPALAEAAPDAFLRAVEKSLQQSDVPVTQLITETGNSSMGNCWHCGLLWALETLAWAPNRLARVALILARLSHMPMEGNWGNTPSKSLLNIFRYWLPQTAAGLPDRIQVLELLIGKDEKAAFGVLEGLLEDGLQVVLPSARPKWREDDAGAGRGVTHAEVYGMIDAAKEKILQLSEGNAHRIAALFQTGLQHPQELPKVLALMEPFTETTATDEDRETLRAALRERIHRHRNYDESPESELNEWLGPVETLYERLAPQDLVVRHCWLFVNWFEKGPLDLPQRGRDESLEEMNNIVMRMRTSALTEIYRGYGMIGVENLIARCVDPETVGSTFVKVTWHDGISWPEWIAEKDFAPDTPMTRCISGFLLTVSSPASDDLLRKLITLGKQHDWGADRFARLLVLARVEPETWQLAENCGSEVHAAYWQTVQPNIFLHQKEPEFVLERLLEFKRPRTALWFCTSSRSSRKQVPPRQFFSVLQQILQGEEADAPQINSHYLAEMLAWLEKSGQIEKTELILLEFGLFPALGYGGETRAAALYEGIMSDPSLFTELICLYYKLESGEQEELPEGTRMAAERAGKILHTCKRLPGTQPDGTIDSEALTRFVDAARESCRKTDRLEVCDSTLGQILAHAPEDQDGAWPCAPVRDLLEHPELEEMRDGFEIGTHNKRGVTSRAYGEGGGQERDLAAYYREQAGRLHNSHPNAAVMLEKIAKGYDHDGKREDIRANLRKEQF